MRTLVILGILLLIGTAIGVKMVMDQSSSSVSAANGKSDADRPPNQIISFGHFDVEPGVAALYPRQFGKVTYLIDENKKVKEGDLLLQVDDEMTKLKVKQAAAAVKAAEQTLAEAKQLPKLYALQVLQQKQAIYAIDSEIKKLAQDEKIRLKPLTPNDALYVNTVKFFEFGFEQLNAKKEVEKLKLQQIDLQDANLKIALAQADVEGKKALQEEAAALLDYYKVVAPSDGMVLRVYVHKGETLGPNPRIHAIDFVPKAPIIVRAEVLQEWARYVKVGEEVTIADDTYHGPTWKGKVKSLSNWFALTRTPVIEPFRFNDVRTLECIIEVTEGAETKRIGQRVRAMIQIKEP